MFYVSFFVTYFFCILLKFCLKMWYSAGMGECSQTQLQVVKYALNSVSKIYPGLAQGWLENNRNFFNKHWKLSLQNPSMTLRFINNFFCENKGKLLETWLSEPNYKVKRHFDLVMRDIHKSCLWPIIRNSTTGEHCLLVIKKWQVLRMMCQVY